VNSIFGFSSRTGENIHASEGIAMCSTLNHWNAATQNEWNNHNCFLGSIELNQSETEGSFYIYHDWVIAADAILFNIQDLKKNLSIAKETNPSFSQLILEAYIKWGKDCPKYLNGEFAFVIYNKEKDYYFLARDHHGIKPLYYFLDQSHLAFATEMKGILKLSFVPKTIDEQYIADFICRIWLNNEQTLYYNIKRFPPAHGATINQKGIQFHSYWDLSNLKKIEFKRESDYVDAFEEKLIQAIQSRADTNYGIGTELSGGLDSSLVSLFLQKNTQKDINAYTYILPPSLENKGLFSDREKVMEVCNQAAITDIDLLIDEGKGLLDSLAWNIRVQDEPPFEFNSLFRDGLFELMSNRNQKTLFSGFGGDEMASSQASGYLKQLYLEGKKELVNHEIGELAKRKNKPKLLLHASLYLKTWIGDRMVDNILKSFGSSSKLERKLLERPLLAALFNQLDIKGRFTEYQSSYTRTGYFLSDQIRRMQEPHVSLRLEYMAHAAKSYQVEYRYPLLDVELIEFYLGLPTELKARNGEGRYIFKKVLERHLPERFVWSKTKKGSSNPQVFGRTKLDGKQVIGQLNALNGAHGIWNYLDKNKLKKYRERFKNENRSTTDFTYLLLAKKLEDYNHYQ